MRMSTGRPTTTMRRLLARSPTSSISPSGGIDSARHLAAGLAAAKRKEAAASLLERTAAVLPPGNAASVTALCEEALRLLDGAARQRALLLRSLARVQAQGRRYEEASATYREALDLIGTFAPEGLLAASVLDLMGDLAKATNDLEGAMTWWKKALALWDRLAQRLQE